MNVVDSSAWIEYFTGGLNSGFFEPAILATQDLIVPSVVILEVYKHIRRNLGRNEALSAVASMKQGTVANLDEHLALAAGEICVEYQLALADSIILATAILHDANLWTQDAHFAGFEMVRFRPK